MDAPHIALHTASFILGLIVVFAVTVSLLRTVVVPRPLRSNYSDLIAGIVLGSARLVARTRSTYRGKDSALAWGGPLLILGMLIGWLIGFHLAYTLLVFGTNTDRTISEAWRQAGSSLFTLGLVGAHNDTVTLLDFCAAATGPIVIAMLIGFLPTVYSSYLNREKLMADLSLSAGDPMWAPEWLVRAQLTGSMDALVAELKEASDWATRLRLTHTTYPVLIHVRSPRFTRHYVVTMLGLLDTAALLASLSTKVPHGVLFRLLLHGSQSFDALYLLFFAPRSFRSRIPVVGNYLTRNETREYTTFSLPSWQERLVAVHQAAARDSAIGMASVPIGALTEGESKPITLTRADFDAAVAMMTEAGLEIDQNLDEAWAMFSRIRARYEFPAYEMARRLDAVPAPWSGPRNDTLPTMTPTSSLQMLKDEQAKRQTVKPSQGDEQPTPKPAAQAEERPTTEA